MRWRRTSSLAVLTSVAILDLRVLVNGQVFTKGLTRGRDDRLRLAEKFFGASRRPARPAQRLRGDQAVVAVSSSVPSGSCVVTKAIGRTPWVRERGVALRLRTLRIPTVVQRFV
jgi:hypothetical protein